MMGERDSLSEQMGTVKRQTRACYEYLREINEKTSFYLYDGIEEDGLPIDNWLLNLDDYEEMFVLCDLLDSSISTIQRAFEKLKASYTTNITKETLKKTEEKISKIDEKYEKSIIDFCKETDEIFMKDEEM